MIIRDKVLARFQKWFATRIHNRRDKLPPRGNVAAALVVLERLKTNCDLSMGAHTTERGGQIAGMGAGALRAILQEHGETREFLREGGRTNRGNHETIETLLEAVRQAGLADAVPQDRARILHELQGFLMKHAVVEYFNRQRIKFEYNPNKPIRAVVAEILRLAKERGQDGYIAQHLVGAKLDIRYRERSDFEVSNFAGSASDEQAGRAGDFEIGDTAFHVTVAPSDATLRRCKANLAVGLASFLIVPRAKLPLAHGLAEQVGIEVDISIEPIESFVGQNVSELGEFSRDGLKRELSVLLDTYNRRVDAVETDKSLLIEIPALLRVDA